MWPLWCCGVWGDWALSRPLSSLSGGGGGQSSISYCTEGEGELPSQVLAYYMTENINIWNRKFYIIKVGCGGNIFELQNMFVKPNILLQGPIIVRVIVMITERLWGVKSVCPDDLIRQPGRGGQDCSTELTGWAVRLFLLLRNYQLSCIKYNRTTNRGIYQPLSFNHRCLKKLMESWKSSRVRWRMTGRSLPTSELAESYRR